MNRFFASILILRPMNIILCIFSVLIAAFIVDGLLSPILPYAMLTVLCFAGASNILNDVLDIHIDKINRPERVLPKGSLRIQDSLILMSLLYAIGIMTTTFLQPVGRLIALVIILPLLFLYTPLFKRLPFLGNLVVGSVLGLVFVFTEGALYGSVDKMWIPFYLVTALSTIRELCKDGEDISGDSKEGLQTFPGKFGLISTLRFLRILSIVFCFFAITPFTYGIYGIYYLLTLILGVQIPLLYSVFILLRENSCSSDYSKVAKILKVITIFGMLVIFSSAF